jgi:hypothetical protein
MRRREFSTYTQVRVKSRKEMLYVWDYTIIIGWIWRGFVFTLVRVEVRELTGGNTRFYPTL